MHSTILVFTSESDATRKIDNFKLYKDRRVKKEVGYVGREESVEDYIEWVKTVYDGGLKVDHDEKGYFVQLKDESVKSNVSKRPQPSSVFLHSLVYFYEGMTLCEFILNKMELGEKYYITQAFDFHF